MTTPDDIALFYRFFTEVGIINQLSAAKLEQHLPGRMTSTQFGIVGHLSRRPEGRTPLEIASAFQVPKTSMTHMLAGLETLGFITLTSNPKDKRSKIAKATPEGIAFLGQKMAVMGRDLGPIIAELGRFPFAETLPHLERIREALDAERDPVDAAPPQV